MPAEEVPEPVAFEQSGHHAVESALQAADLLNPNANGADYRLYVSDIPLRFQTIGERFLGRSLEQLEMVSLG